MNMERERNNARYNKLEDRRNNRIVQLRYRYRMDFEFLNI